MKSLTPHGARLFQILKSNVASRRKSAKTAKTLEECVPLIDRWAEAAKKVRSDVIVLCHGGPIAMPEDASYILKHSKHVNGFYGASSMERLPTETAIKGQTEAFKKITF